MAPVLLFFDWSVAMTLGISCSNLLLSVSHRQGQKVATCLFITSPRSSEMQSSCKCSCLLATSSLPKSLWTERLIRANVLVSKMEKKKNKPKYIQNSLAYLCCGCITLAWYFHIMLVTASGRFLAFPYNYSDILI